MAKRILIDEIHLRVFVPAGLPEEQCLRVHRTLIQPRFLSGLRRSVRGLFRKHPSLRKAHCTISH